MHNLVNYTQVWANKHCLLSTIRVSLGQVCTVHTSVSMCIYGIGSQLTTNIHGCLSCHGHMLNTCLSYEFAVLQKELINPVQVLLPYMQQMANLADLCLDSAYTQIRIDISAYAKLAYTEVWFLLIKMWFHWWTYSDFLITLHSLMPIIVTLEKILEFTSHTYIISVYPWNQYMNDQYNLFRKCINGNHLRHRMISS